ncbi:uncharacterized protein BJ171DRAFT_459609 [Polychytrium aggregatum]|uniref:uncharacterized protein n=1 Tax=Polychytrium aggregatum TaxID=110093 RepID=UPI0022FED4D3|nr:uncharacterized protein BJ171DRAFT_459609 [Polychytrium aggregatum]KAI9204256.1 hypothetical protein BJ171DRAFT_459609 [Polychytrium aggregatum]
MSYPAKEIEASMDYDCVVDLLHESKAPAVASTDSRSLLTHSALKSFIMGCPIGPIKPKPNLRVGIALPDSPELAVCLITLMTYCTAVPLSVSLTAEEFEVELKSLKAKCMILPDPVVNRLEGLGIPVFLLTPDSLTAGLFSIQSCRQRQEPPKDNRRSRAYSMRHEYSAPEDEAMLLRTSGTSGNKKTVPYTLRTLLVGAMCVARSWGLKEGEVNLNMMPMYHVGGIVRNCLAVILSRSCVIMTKGFDPVVFWDIMENSQVTPTWYFAVPTMHHAILQEGRQRFTGAKKVPTSIRMICNAGGGLLPSLAVELREYFGCTVLPSYGMTECMPATTPPLNYKLDRPGTSGISVGPEIAIFDGNGDRMPLGQIGNIGLRGVPCFGGYEGDEAATKKAFNKEGFFDTGDMGYMDKEGYLFITGRSKEVINRGGEIISPVEIEDAVVAHPRVQQTLAYSIAHDVLQETIGVVIVSEPGAPRVDLKELQNFVSKTLHPSKWPQAICYMDKLPKNQGNKPLRIGLATRLGIKEMTDKTPMYDRLFEAHAPPVTASIKEPIPSRLVIINEERVKRLAEKHPDVKEAAVLPNPDGSINLYIGTSYTGLDQASIKKHMDGRIHDYEHPKKAIFMPKLPRFSDGELDYDALEKMGSAKGGDSEGMPPMQKMVAQIFKEALELDHIPGAGDDFFELGGNSLTAGRLASLIRKRFDVTIAAMMFFQSRTVEQIAGLISEMLPADFVMEESEMGAAKNRPPRPRKPSPAKSSVAPVTLFIQALPFFFGPCKVVLQWITFAYGLKLLEFIYGIFFDQRRTPAIRTLMVILSLIGTKLSFWTILPILGILTKWIIIGRYKAGSYPLWGSYYLRWWWVDQVLNLCGHGIFGGTNFSRVLYLRLMGASIGKNVHIDSMTNIREFDLVRIGHGCAFDTSRVRPFTMETGKMVLMPIRIGHYCVVNVSTVIAPGATVPNNTVFPPLSSSYELEDASTKYTPLCRTTAPSPNLFVKALLGYPILFLVWFISSMPWMFVLNRIAQVPFTPDNSLTTSFAEILLFFGNPARVGLHMAAVCCNQVLSPIVGLLCCIVIKRVFIGKFKAGPRKITQLNLLRYWLMEELLGDGTFRGVSALIGKHYELTSIIYRALGSRVGKRIYWPGTPVKVYEFDLFEVGNDVVFGSRSHIANSDHFQSAKIIIRSGAMLADRCVLLPGCTIGRNCVMGSGGLGKAFTYYPDGSIWIGSKNGGATLWDAGDPVAARSQDTRTPFARAFYMGTANFFVLPEAICILYSTFFEAFTGCYWTMGITGAAMIGRIAVMHNWFGNNITYLSYFWPLFFFATATGTFQVLSFGALFITIAMKWMTMGRRKVGRYDWDLSSYCQRWQIMLGAQSIRHGLLDRIRGSWYIVAFFRALGAKVGKRVCLYPTGGDPMMTEPDLTTFGDDVALDRASVVCHINSKGQFALNPLVIGSGAVLRAYSRLLSGAEMEEDSTLLEHTLVISGDIIEAGTVWQGWPSSEVTPKAPVIPARKNTDGKATLGRDDRAGTIRGSARSTSRAGTPNTGSVTRQGTLPHRGQSMSRSKSNTRERPIRGQSDSAEQDREGGQRRTRRYRYSQFHGTFKRSTAVQGR